jgi:hypothetical protein
MPTGRVIQRSPDKIIMKRPEGTLVQRSVVGVFSGSKDGCVTSPLLPQYRPTAFFSFFFFLCLLYVFYRAL